MIRLFSNILFVIVLVSCSGPVKNDTIFVRPANPAVQKTISTAGSDADIYLSEGFWEHFTSHFKSASVELFMVSKLPYPKLLSDTAYDFAMITDENRSRLLSYLPKDLSKEESMNYREEMTIAAAKNYESNDTTRVKWHVVSGQIEKDYNKLYQLISGKGKDYIIIIKKNYLQSILKRMENPI